MPKLIWVFSIGNAVYMAIEDDEVLKEQWRNNILSSCRELNPNQELQWTQKNRLLWVLEGSSWRMTQVELNGKS